MVTRPGQHDDPQRQPNGTTDPFAAINLATGQVLTHCHHGHPAKRDMQTFHTLIDALRDALRHRPSWHFRQRPCTSGQHGQRPPASSR